MEILNSHKKPYLEQFENVGNHDGDSTEGCANDSSDWLTWLITWETVSTPVHTASSTAVILLLFLLNKL